MDLILEHSITAAQKVYRRCAPEEIRTPNLLIRSRDAPLLIAGIQGTDRHHNPQTGHRRQQCATVRGQERGQRSLCGAAGVATTGSTLRRPARTRTSPDVGGNAAAGGRWVTGHFSGGWSVSCRCMMCAARLLGAHGRTCASCRIRTHAARLEDLSPSELKLLVQLVRRLRDSAPTGRLSDRCQHEPAPRAAREQRNVHLPCTPVAPATPAGPQPALTD